MRLTLTSIKIQIALYSALYIFLLAFETLEGQTGYADFILLLKQIVPLGLFYYGLKRGYLVVAILFGLWSVMVFTNSVSNLAYTSMPGTVVLSLSGILSFVALCGLVIWFKNEKGRDAKESLEIESKAQPNQSAG